MKKIGYLLIIILASESSCKIILNKKYDTSLNYAVKQKIVKEELFRAIELTNKEIVQNHDYPYKLITVYSEKTDSSTYIVIGTSMSYDKCDLAGVLTYKKKLICIYPSVELQLTNLINLEKVNKVIPYRYKRLQRDENETNRYFFDPWGIKFIYLEDGKLSPVFQGML